MHGREKGQIPLVSYSAAGGRALKPNFFGIGKLTPESVFHRKSEKRKKFGEDPWFQGVETE